MTATPDAPLGPALVDEAAARRILLLRACETEPVSAAVWSPEDAAWATRVADETVGPTASSAHWLDERARHACERLLPRDRSLAAWLQRPARRGLGALTVFAALLLGLLADSLGGSPYVNLLAPPLLTVLAWNGLVYLLLGIGAIASLRGGRAASDLLPGPRRALARWLQRGTGPLLPGVATDWAMRAAPLTAARVAALLHLGAAALAAGLVLGLYLRGLVLDFRAGWQSTFLDTEAVHALLAALLAPASALTGIGLPDVATLATLRVGAVQAATASAAPWIHLYSATLVLFVIAPRLALAAGAALQANWRARRIALPLADPYFQRLLARARRARASVQVLPHGAAPAPQAALGLRALLALALGETAVLRIVAPVPYGHEEPAALPAPEPGTTLRVALFDLAATPEPQAQGRLVEALCAGALPLVLLVDEAAWRRRFASLPQRLEERRDSWRRFAMQHRVGLACVDLDASDPADGARDFEAALAVT